MSNINIVGMRSLGDNKKTISFLCSLKGKLVGLILLLWLLQSLQTEMQADPLRRLPAWLWLPLHSCALLDDSEAGGLELGRNCEKEEFLSGWLMFENCRGSKAGIWELVLIKI